MEVDISKFTYRAQKKNDVNKKHVCDTAVLLRESYPAFSGTVCVEGGGTMLLYCSFSSF